MKKSLGILLFLALTLTLGAAPLTTGPNEAYILVNNASVYKDKSLGTVEWSEYLTIGDKVTLQSGVVKMKVDGKDREFYKVKLASGKDGYIRTPLVAGNGTLGVVKTDGALVYSEPRDVKITARTLARGQLVLVSKDGSVDSFIKIVGYDAVKDIPIEESFVAKEDVSINDVDANAIILLTVAKGQKVEAIKRNLLTVAQTKYGTSVFVDLIQAQLAGLTRATKALSGSFTVNDDKVNVRDLPNEKGSKVVGSLEKGKVVTVIGVTADSYTIDGVTAPWYQLSDPAGWVFGSFLTQP